MIIQSVKQYNQEAIARWHKAVDNWDCRKGGFPNLCFYTFSTPKGLHRRRGFVISNEHHIYFRLTKKEVDILLKEIK
jgi:hypothetical protein